MLTSFIECLSTKGEVYLRIKVHPRALSTRVTSVLDDDTIKIDVAAVPEKNKANTELIKLLATIFKVAKTNIRIISGATDHIKLIKIVN